MVVGVKFADHGEVRVLDARTLALVRSIDLPLGEIRLGQFRRTGRCSRSISLPDRPAAVDAVDPATGEVQPLRADPRPAAASPGPARTIPESDAIVQALRDRWARVEYMVAMDEGH